MRRALGRPPNGLNMPHPTNRDAGGTSGGDHGVALAQRHGMLSRAHELAAAVSFE